MTLLLLDEPGALFGGRLDPPLSAPLDEAEQRGVEVRHGFAH